MSIDKATVAKIATLARIRVPEEEQEPLASELSNILGWIEQLAEVDTENVPPMTSVVETTPTMRADAVTDGDCRDDVVANAPAATKGFYTVPKVVE